MNSLLTRITVKDDVCNGKPTIRGYRLTVQTIIEFLLSGTPVEEILRQYPFLEKDDIEASKTFAIAMLDKKFSIKEVAA